MAGVGHHLLKKNGRVSQQISEIRQRALAVYCAERTEIVFLTVAVVNNVHRTAFLVHEYRVVFLKGSRVSHMLHHPYHM